MKMLYREEYNDKENDEAWLLLQVRIIVVVLLILVVIGIGCGLGLGIGLNDFGGSLILVTKPPSLNGTTPIRSNLTSTVLPG